MSWICGRRSVNLVSILGMLEGVLKGAFRPSSSSLFHCFNPWYVGGGVKSFRHGDVLWVLPRFNPWYVGGGVKSAFRKEVEGFLFPFQSLVCWRGC